MSLSPFQFWSYLLWVYTLLGQTNYGKVPQILEIAYILIQLIINMVYTGKHPKEAYSYFFPSLVYAVLDILSIYVHNFSKMLVCVRALQNHRLQNESCTTLTISTLSEDATQNNDSRNQVVWPRFISACPSPHTNEACDVILITVLNSVKTVHYQTNKSLCRVLTSLGENIFTCNIHKTYWSESSQVDDIN